MIRAFAAVLTQVVVSGVLLQLNQKTPLRVLHRRSLLDRKRHVYRIETALLNKHFFLMRLVTSAGMLDTLQIHHCVRFV